MRQKAAKRVCVCTETPEWAAAATHLLLFIAGPEERERLCAFYIGRFCFIHLLFLLLQDKLPTTSGGKKLEIFMTIKERKLEDGQ